jgi:glucosamine 6-phosphate synthetase-like amidotransferase/phosphosugar isomerase protein
LSLDHQYSKEIVALHYVFCMQSVAFHYSVRRGKNPDRPGNLVPYIEL